MSSKPITPALQAWYKWKTLRLPWRRQFLIGLDLQGNTYWEFLDRGTPLPKPSTQQAPQDQQIRYRRIVRPADSASTHPADIRVPPVWHQWLRHTRAAAPSLAEQRGEVARQERMRVLARLADERWEAKARVMEDGGGGGKARIGRAEEVRAAEEGAGEVVDSRGGGGVVGKRVGTGEVPVEEEKDPWKRARGGPSETWQPKTWEPGKK